ncbi:hypothetical protein BX666DRAFT_2029827 [Dichotomocladium elegans]|nr:hypothetical protein BX666DRAFT_2029827 [Dichotomocladium elegans]
MAAIPTENQQRKRTEQHRPSDLAKTYAPRIEVARLAIRATAQTSLFPESIHTSSSSSSPYHLLPLDQRAHQPHHFHSIRHGNHTCGYETNISESPPKFYCMSSSDGHPPSVPSSSTTATSLSAGKRVTFGVNQTFRYPDDPDTPPDSDTQVQDDSAEDDEDDDCCFNTSYDDDDVDDDEAQRGGSTSVSTPPSTVEPPVLRLDPKTDPRTVIPTTHQAKGYRFIQDEVLNQLSKRRQYEATAATSQWQQPPLPPSPSSSPTSPAPDSTISSSASSSTSATSVQSVETQLSEFIEKAKAASLQKKKKRLMQRASASEPVLPRLTQANTEFGASLLSELNRITGLDPQEADHDDDATTAGGSSNSSSADKRHTRAISETTALLPSLRYTELRTPKVIYASRDDDDDNGDDHPEESATAVATASSSSSNSTSLLPMREPIWRSFSSQSTATLPLVDRIETTKPGRLYIRVLAAEDLDFPIDKDTAESIRCVLSIGAKDYVSDYMPMDHTVAFGHDFHFDVDPDTEFTMTLQIRNSSCNQNEHNNNQQQQLQLRNLFGKNGSRRKSSVTRGDSILRYVNRRDRAIAQARISMESIMPKCRGRLCTASFALVNSWYRFARSAFIPNKSRQAPERAVGKLTAKLLFLPQTSPSMVTSLPTTFAECEEGFNVLRDARHCWKTGYMSQIGGDVKYWRRRFYSLKGWRLFSYPDSSSIVRTPRTVLDLSRATCVVVDNRILSSTAEAAAAATADGFGPIPQQQQLLQIPLFNSSSNNNSVRPSSASSVLSATTASDEDLASCSVKNSFRIVFETGESVDFFCDSSNEREQWLSALCTVIARVPKWPEWIPKEDEENDLFLTAQTNPIHGDEDNNTVHIPPAGLPVLAVNQ